MEREPPFVLSENGTRKTYTLPDIFDTKKSGVSLPEGHTLSRPVFTNKDGMLHVEMKMINAFEPIPEHMLIGHPLAPKEKRKKGRRH